MNKPEPISAADALRQAQREIEHRQEIIADFQAKVGADPAYAFSWAEGAIKAAAELKVWCEVHAAVENGWAPGSFAAELNAQALRAAKFPPASTSQISNLVDLAVNAARADIAARLEGL